MRPGSLLAAVDFEDERRRLNEGHEHPVTDFDLASYLMYPKVFLDYQARHETYGPVRTLPTKTFFYGMEPGEEISAEIDPGKILEIRLQAVGETDENGEVKVFFELNGQPRSIRVPNRKVKAETTARPKAEQGNPAHVGAPMPGKVFKLLASVGKKMSAASNTSSSVSGFVFII